MCNFKMWLPLSYQFFAMSTNLCQRDCFRYTWAVRRKVIMRPLVPIKSSITVTSYGRYGVCNQQQFDCLFNKLFRFTSKTTSKLRILVPFVSWIRPAVSLTKGTVLRRVFPWNDVMNKQGRSVERKRKISETDLFGNAFFLLTNIIILQTFL